MTVAPARDHPYVFVSYASVDRERVLSLVRDVQGSGIPAWVDQADITGGVSYGPEITSGIKEATALVLMCSAASLASRNVRQEIQLAWRFERPILPVLLEAVTFPDELVYWLEGAQWIETYGASRDNWLDKLRRALFQHGFRATVRPVDSASTSAIEQPPPRPAGNLPDNPEPLLGRDQEVRRLQALLSNGRLTTITGPGGAGKTRLAMEVASRTAPAYPQGVWLIDASADRSAVELERTIAATLGVVEGPGESTLDALARHLGEYVVLLVIDNLEQIADAREALDRLSECCIGLRLICTSRAATRSRAELVFPISGLSIPTGDSSMLAVDVAQNPAVALFVARAQRARPEFALSDANAAAIAAICARLDGLPLAIELAAARARMLPPAAILERLESSLNLLTRGGSAISGRQSALRSTIAWSYDLLSPEAQRAFRTLAVFSGGGAVPAAEAVIGTADALDALDDLVDQSLLRLDDSTGDEEQLRIRMLETIREFAAEQLSESGADAATRDAHAAWYLALAEDAASALDTGADTRVLDGLEFDHANLRAALRWLALQSNETRPYDDLRLANALWRFWWIRGHLGEGLETLQASVARRSGAPAAIRAQALISAAVLAEGSGKPESAASMLDEAIVLAGFANDQSLLARAIDGRGTVAEGQGDYESAMSRYQEALAVYRELANERGVAATLHHLSSAATLQGLYDDAKRYATEALAIWRELGELQSISYTLQQLGILTFLDGDYDGAVRTYEECVAIAETLDDKVGLGNALLNLGSAMEMNGDLAGAKGTLERSLAILAEVGDEGGVGYVEYLLGHVARANGEVGAARLRLLHGLEKLSRVGDRASVALVLETLAGVELDSGNPEHAARLMGAAERERTETGAALPASRRDEVQHDRAGLGDALTGDHLARAFADGRSLAIDDLIRSG